MRVTSNGHSHCGPDLFSFWGLTGTQTWLLSSVLNRERVRRAGPQQHSGSWEPGLSDEVARHVPAFPGRDWPIYQVKFLDSFCLPSLQFQPRYLCSGREEKAEHSHLEGLFFSREPVPPSPCSRSSSRPGEPWPVHPRLQVQSLLLSRGKAQGATPGCPASSVGHSCPRHTQRPRGLMFPLTL